MWGLRLPTSIHIVELSAPVGLNQGDTTPMNQPPCSTDNHQPLEQYEMRVKGHLDQRWSHWFGGWAIALKDNGETHLSGTVVDQAALYGLLMKVRDLGLPLVSVMRIQPKPIEQSDLPTGERR